jgi:hypothetical protein
MQKVCRRGFIATRSSQSLREQIMLKRLERLLVIETSRGK